MAVRERPQADVDRYSIDVEAGQRIAFEVVGSRLGQDFDPVVTIKDARGRRLVEHDNDVGLMFDCRFAHTFEQTGTYTIEVADTRFRGISAETMSYRPGGRDQPPAATIERSRDSLIQSEARFRDLAELIPQTIFEMDLQGGLTFINRTGWRYSVSVTRKIRNGANIHDYLIAEDFERMNRGLAGASGVQSPTGKMYGIQKEH